MVATINNSFRLLGTIVSPFTKTKHGNYTVYEVEIEVEAGESSYQTILLTLYPDGVYLLANIDKDYIGIQVAISGFLQGNKYVSAEGKVIYYMYAVVREFTPISKGNDDDKKKKNLAARGIVVASDEIPF